ncbi:MULTISPECIES: hemerythrin domain-containing protein [unclassified Streptomyces]|uniref:hemerythrin domain-containing protein n=1 Tax=unclassified Streptomyces TaxID=2593676 RepID=UPI0007DD4EB4|nr:hemerythrin domain-containing protein [Streptomyces sp. SAT1]ANH94883.1 hemerythrin HHE cation-binding protein [Streptomyces sp. SAT1]
MDRRSGIVEELTRDHARVQHLFDRIRAAPPGSPERTALVERAAAELVRNGVAEKAHLYPAVRRFLPDGERRAAHGLRRLRETEELLVRLAAAHGEDATRLLVALVTQVGERFVEEQQELFPRLQALCPAEVLRDLGTRARAAAASAPTRPRPAAPDAAPLVKVTARVWGPLDRLRDLATRRGRP